MLYLCFREKLRLKRNRAAALLDTTSGDEDDTTVKKEPVLMNNKHSIKPWSNNDTVSTVCFAKDNIVDPSYTSAAKAAYARAGMQSADMDLHLMQNMRVQHLYQLYNSEGDNIPHGPISDAAMISAYKQLEVTKKAMEAHFVEYALQQDMFTSRFQFIGERLVTVINRAELPGLRCRCLEGARRFKVPATCERCLIPANILTTIPEPCYVEKLVDNIYVVCYGKGGVLQLCGVNGRKITLSWVEVGFIAWCGSLNHLCKNMLAALVFSIPVGSQKEIVVDVANEKYIFKGPGNVSLDLGGFRVLSDLQDKCRDFGFRSSTMYDLTPFIPDFFIKKKK